MSEVGFNPNQLQGTISEEFICPICKKIVKDPQECRQCGQLYCKVCIEQYFPKYNTCTNKCNQCPDQIGKIKGALSKFYNNLDIKCENSKCNQVVKLIDYIEHQKKCSRIKCQFYDLCQQFSSQQDPYKNKVVCGNICYLLTNLIENLNDTKKQRESIQEFLKSGDLGPVVNLPVISMASSVPGPQGTKQSIFNNQLFILHIVQIRWDQNKCGTGISISSDRTQVFLKESAYMFRTVLTDIPFMSGINYWEIVADSRTENELKIGVCTQNFSNFNSAFCDTPHGWAYYGLAQLRHNSNASGLTFGKRFKKEGILGICLNMNTGTLSFALNNEFMGVAFKDVGLTKGPIFAAVALLHCAGCTIVTGKPVPSYMINV